MINKNLIMLDEEGDNKNKIVLQLAEQALSSGYISEVVEYINAVNEREKVSSTFIGYGISIPHGRSSAVKKPFVAFMRAKTGFKWDEDSEEDTRLVFLIGVPKEKTENLHLRILAQISRLLMEEDFRKKLLTANHDEAYLMLKKIEADVLQRRYEQ